MELNYYRTEYYHEIIKYMYKKLNIYFANNKERKVCWLDRDPPYQKMFDTLTVGG